MLVMLLGSRGEWGCQGRGVRASTRRDAGPCLGVRGSGVCSDGKAEPEVGDRDRKVFLDKVLVDGDGRGGSLTGGGDDLRSRVDGVTGGPQAGDRGGTGGLD